MLCKHWRDAVKVDRRIGYYSKIMLLGQTIKIEQYLGKCCPNDKMPCHIKLKNWIKSVTRRKTIAYESSSAVLRLSIQTKSD